MDKMHGEVIAYSGSDWASDKEARKSSSAGIVMVGRYMLKGHTRKQQLIARSSIEAELYAAVLGASDAKGMVSLLRDLGHAMTPTLVIDAKATGHVLHRQNTRRMKHIEVAHLWLHQHG